MGRVTRQKAAELAESLYIDEDEILELPGNEVAPKANLKSATPEPSNRPPLSEIAPNSADSKAPAEEGEVQELRKSTRGKKGKKGGAKAKKNDLSASTASQPDTFHDAQDVVPDEHDSIPSPASETAAEDLLTAVPELAILDTTRPRSPPSAAVKLTRSQLKRQADVKAEPKSLVDGLGQTADETETMEEEILQDTNIAGETNDSIDPALNTDSQSVLDAPASPPPSAVPNVIKHLRTETPAKRSASNKENIEPEETMATPQASSNYDELENAVVSATATPSRSAQPSPRPEDPIVALDQLDDAVENVSKDIPEVQTSPEKPKKASTPTKKAAPVIRTTKAAAARISMMQEKKAASEAQASGRPRASMALGRASSVRESSSGGRPAPAGKRITSTSSTKDDKAADGERKEVVIPHSKPRPISMSFPPPPPPPKSTKAPTQSTFHLPGEAVAAKLKAAREARQQKETREEEKKPAFKARPVPSALSKAPAVRPTNASKARESVMNGKEFKMPTTGASAAHKRANSVATTRPSGSGARVGSNGLSSRLAAANEKASGPSATARPRPSTSMAHISKTRLSTSSATTTGTQRVVSNGGKGTLKGREVFNRAAAAKANADKEKQEREAATKKARAEAGERSRQLSREFAEKQRAKKMAAAGKQSTAEGAAGVTA